MKTNPPQPGELRWTKNLPSLLLKVYYCMHSAVMGLLARINSKLIMGENIPNIHSKSLKYFDLQIEIHEQREKSLRKILQ